MTIKLLTAKEVSEVLCVTVDRVYSLAREGILPCVHLSRQLRFHPELLEKFILQGGKALPGGWKKNQ